MSRCSEFSEAEDETFRKFKSWAELSDGRNKASGRQDACGTMVLLRSQERAGLTGKSVRDRVNQRYGCRMTPEVGNVILVY